MKSVNRLLAIIPLTLTVLLFAAPVLAQSRRFEGWHLGRAMMGGWGMGWFGGILMIIFWILVLMAVVFFIKWLIQSFGRGRTNLDGGSRALEILRERYARGEIDKIEFNAMKKDLSE